MALTSRLCFKQTLSGCSSILCFKSTLDMLKQFIHRIYQWYIAYVLTVFFYFTCHVNQNIEQTKIVVVQTVHERLGDATTKGKFDLKQAPSKPAFNALFIEKRWAMHDEHSKVNTLTLL